MDIGFGVVSEVFYYDGLLNAGGGKKCLSSNQYRGEDNGILVMNNGIFDFIELDQLIVKNHDNFIIHNAGGGIQDKFGEIGIFFSQAGEKLTQGGTGWQLPFEQIPGIILFSD
jgi:hypothetical protein